MFQGVQIETQSEQQALTDWHAQRTAWRAPRAYPLQGYRTQGRAPFQTLSEGVEQMRRGCETPSSLEKCLRTWYGGKFTTSLRDGLR